MSQDTKKKMTIDWEAVLKVNIPEIGAMKSPDTSLVTEALLHCYSAQCKLVLLGPSPDTFVETLLQQDGAHDKLRRSKRALMRVDALQKKGSAEPALEAEAIGITEWDLSAIGGGEKDGKNWDDILDKKTSLKDMLAQFKQGELCDVDPIHRLEKINACQTVVHKVCWLSFGYSELRSQGTKLRALVKAEVVELRGYAGKSKEKDILPKKLLDRVQAALGGSA
eukprot:2197423-Amphidinium_carterae.4